MLAYELLARLKHLTLTSDGEGGVEWVGTNDHWLAVRRDEEASECN